MKRIWCNYNKWEDYKNGFYSTFKNKNEESISINIIKLFEDEQLFFEKGIEMIKAWPMSSDYNLTNTATNRKSYLGQAVACYMFGASSRFTAKVFQGLPKETQCLANRAAISIIKYYEENVYDETNKNIVWSKNEKLF